MEKPDEENLTALPATPVGWMQQILETKAEVVLLIVTGALGCLACVSWWVGSGENSPFVKGFPFGAAAGALICLLISWRGLVVTARKRAGEWTSFLAEEKKRAIAEWRQSQKKDDSPPAPQNVRTVPMPDMDTALTIHSATWGAVNGEGQKLDVTEKVKLGLHKKQNGQMWIDMAVTRFEFDDPRRGYQKELIVFYSGIRKVPEWDPPYRLQLTEGFPLDNGEATLTK